MIRYLHRRRTKKVIKRLSPLLMKGYGSRDYYTVGQVEANSIELCKRQKQIALALFCEYTSLKFDSDKEKQAVAAIRQDIANDYFEGRDYNARDILNLLGGSGWKGGNMDDNLSHHFGMHARY
ncbi:DUF6559 family protein [Vibrio nigripulchritudo]|uniref:DUF6559 family protein n=1 Tax=Vibrio nigripulchritudo TaxID=28173 RepID=UPI0005FA1849|nr:DUF6559 family protein [Vibrio nigripulchritudo]KJY76465.1 hypothetical protein TW74_15535 [Vibrio nigripulchritudo]